MPTTELITEYHCTVFKHATFKKAKTIGEYVATLIPREGDMINVDGEVYLVKHVLWDINSRRDNAIAVGIYVG